MSDIKVSKTKGAGIWIERESDEKQYIAAITPNEARELVRQLQDALGAELKRLEIDQEEFARLKEEESRWLFASPMHLRAMHFACAKLGVSVRLAGFTPPAHHERIAENERLRQAFEAAESATCDCSPSTGCPESCEKCDWDYYPDSIKHTLRAAMEDK